MSTEQNRRDVLQTCRSRATENCTMSSCRASGSGSSGPITAAKLVLAVLSATGASASTAADWRYWVGVHDFIVDEVDSHTYGLGGGIQGDERTDSGRHYFGSLDLYWDHDQDDLDPDHIPIWWQLHAGTDGELWRASPVVHVDWTADLDTRVNTVSSVERQIEVLPALVARYDGETLAASFKAGIGYWFLEIDDDAPKERGYVRDDLRNTTLAGSLAADASIKLGSWKLVGWAQEWWDDETWLHARYAAELHFDLKGGSKHSEVVLDTEVNQYNLDVYRVAGAVPILPWDDDLFVRLYFVTAW